MKHIGFLISVLLLSLAIGAPAKLTADSQDLTIYIDADYSLTASPAEAIEIGLKTAFAGTWAETGIQIISRDHRTNSRRSLKTIELAAADASAIAIIGGMHSPPYFANGDVINQRQIPLLLPWSAGGMLTRLAEGDDNWIFRLSVDDTKAASKLAGFADRSGCKNIALMFVDNPWGHGNADRLVQEITANGGSIETKQPLPFNAGEQYIVEEVRTLSASSADCMILVTGLALGKKVISAVDSLPSSPQVISHWGILGDRLTNHVSLAAIERVDLAILGTCGLTNAKTHPEIYAHAMKMAQSVSQSSFDPELHPAPHGFFHAHDLGLLILAAVESAQTTADWNKSAKDRRHAFRQALYDQKGAIEGLLKFYNLPFSPVGPNNPDGHEALGASDLCMTSVDEDGNIVDIDSE